MRDGSGWPVTPIPVVILLLLTLVRVSSQMGSNLAPPPSPGSPECFLDDRCTLQTFKAKLSNRGEPDLQTWDSANVTQWKGVTWVAAADGTLFVEKLELGGLSIGGTGVSIYPLLHVGLSHLSLVNISGCNFTSELPSKLMACPSLRVVDLSNNSFLGSFPTSFFCENHGGNSSSPPTSASTSAINLQVFNLSHNLLSGNVPDSLFAKNVGSLSNVSSLVLEENHFYGTIPSSLGNCAGLVELKLSGNNFSGSVPFAALGKLSNLQILEASDNNITGGLDGPFDAGRFPQLTSLALGSNSLAGPIPDSLGNLSKLTFLELNKNNFSGSIPSALARLSNLDTLALNKNLLDGVIPPEFSQLASLTTLYLSDNKLSGSIWPQLSNCTNLQSLWLSMNNFVGAVPPELGNLTDLVVLSLYGNKFDQTIPAELGTLDSLVALDLSFNHLVGNFPNSFCDLYQLQVLLLNNNNLSGGIPSCIGNFSYIRILDFSFNSLTGQIPGDLNNLSVYSGALEKAPDALSSAIYQQDFNSQPLTFGFSQSPISFFFNNNFLTGQIPAAFGYVKDLQQLKLNNNLLFGSIPSALGNASALLLLDLSVNQLDGSIPSSLTDLNFLANLNLSFNNLSGPIPEASQFLTFTDASFLGNPGLCGFLVGNKCGSSGAPSASNSLRRNYKRPLGRKLLPLYIILASAVLCCLFLGGLVIWSWIGGCSRRNCSLVSNDGDLYETKEDLQFFHVTISSALPSLNPKELAMATDYYNESNIIGDGGFGLVYRAVLNNGAVVAVKKLVEDGAQGQTEFLAEMRTLGKIKHRNLVSLLGYCAYGKERLLVYEYMRNGSLDTWLHCRDEGVASLDWRTLLKVARGAAEGLAFLHHVSNPTIIHRDIKASNILLDCDFEARLADFGLARSAKAYESHVSTDFAGTAGYIPPEYSQASAATTKGDVYSFGVVLFEILTGRRPTDPFFRKKEMSHVVTWILDMSMEEAIEKTLDMSSTASTEEMLELMRIACLCCQNTPSKRPTMGEVVQMLDSLENQQSPSRSPSIVLYDEAMSSPRCR